MNTLLNLILMVAGGILAIYAFSFLLGVPKEYRPCAAFSGGMGSLVYVLGNEQEWGTVLSSFLSALLVAVLSHVLAMILKAPVTLFLVAGILPTVPGTGMYQSVHYMIEGNGELTSYYLVQTLETAGVIALAIFLADTLFGIRNRGSWKQNSLKYIRNGKDKTSETKKEEEQRL